MEENEKEHDMSLEDRSEKVRELLGEIPKSLVRWGIAIIVTISIAIVTALLVITQR